jgi:hypothetical protein
MEYENISVEELDKEVNKFRQQFLREALENKISHELFLSITNYGYCHYIRGLKAGKNIWGQV